MFRLTKVRFNFNSFSVFSQSVESKIFIENKHVMMIGMG